MEILANEQDAIDYQEGDPAALTRLWERNKRFLYRYCMRFYNARQALCDRCGVEQEDLYQESFLALIEAAQAFDPGKGYRFITWLGFPLKNRFNGLLGRKGAPRPLNSCESLDELITDGETDTREALIPDPAAQEAFENVEASIYNEQLHTALNAAMDTLEPKHQDILKCRYYEEKTLKACADALSLPSAYYARSLVCTALQRMRRGQAFRILKRFLADTSAVYTATGFSAWKHNGSIEERIIERAERKLTASL